MEFRVGVGEWNCRFFVSKFLTQRRRDAEYAEFLGLPSAEVRGQESGVRSQYAGVMGAGGLPPVKKSSVSLCLCASVLKISISVGFMCFNTETQRLRGTEFFGAAFGRGQESGVRGQYAVVRGS